MVQQIENDADTFGVYAKIFAKLTNEIGPREIGFCEHGLCFHALRQQPFLLDPKFQRLLIDVATVQKIEFADVHDHMSRRGS